MRKMPLIIALLALACTGCLDLRVKMDVKANKAGSFEFRLELLDQMYQLIQVQGKQAGLDLSMIDKEPLKALVTENNGKLKRYNNVVENGVRKIDFNVTFADTQKLLDKVGGNMLVMSEEDEGTWKLSFADTEYGASFADMSPELLEQQISGFLPLMKGMRMSLELSVPELVETNLKQGQNGALIYDLDFDRDIADKQGKEAVDAFRGLLNPKYVTFKGIKP